VGEQALLNITRTHEDIMLKAKAEMLIRVPAERVFDAFIDPVVTSKFWFSRGSGRLEPGKTIQWDWEMYGFSLDVVVKAIDPSQRIVVEWSGAGQHPTTIEWAFRARADGTTYVTVTNFGFQGDLEHVAQQAIGSTEGFAFLLAGAKAWLEHGLRLNLVQDKHPDGLPIPGD
jgi:uncharacterized protein YndB with AHSA1/START domain